MSTSLPEDDLLIDLRSLACAKSDEKLSVSDEYIVLQPPSPGLWMFRYLKGDNRRRTTEKVKKIVDYCIEFSQTHIEMMLLASCCVTSSAHHFDFAPRCRERFQRLEILTRAMSEALSGLQKLELTYIQTVAAQINVRVIKLEQQIAQNSKSLQQFRSMFGSLPDPQDL